MGAAPRRMHERNPRGTIANRYAFYSELAREKMWSRIHLIPVLQAEEDRDLVRRHWAEQAREKELLGANSKVYNNDRYVASNRTCCEDFGFGRTLISGQVRASYIRSHTPRDHQVEKGERGIKRAEKVMLYILRVLGRFSTSATTGR